MGLRAVFANAATVAFNAFDDVPEAATLFVESSVYDPGSATNVVSSVSHAIEKLALVRFKREELGAPLSGDRGRLISNAFPIESGDVKGIFRISELATGVVPKHKDRVEADGRSWTIIDLVKDPAEVIWILQLRTH